MSEYQAPVIEFCQRISNQEYVLLGGRANTLWAAFLKSIPEKKYIIFPAVMCISPIMTAQYLGFKPLLCDVNLSDANINKDGLEELLKVYGNDVGAVLAVDLYGNRADITKLSEVCKLCGVPLIEDAAQALGVKDMGDSADACLVSFGHTKIIDCKLGGGWLTNNEMLYENVKSNLKEFSFITPETQNKLSAFYRLLYFQVRDLMNEFPIAMQLYGEFYKYFHELMFVDVRQVDWKCIDEAVGQFEEELDRRRYHVSVFLDQLRDIPIQALGFSKLTDSAPWRFSFLVRKKLRDDLLYDLRSKKIDVSSWYPTMEGWFSKSDKGIKCENARKISDSVVNLWVDSKDLDYSKRVANQVRSYFFNVAS